MAAIVVLPPSQLGMKLIVASFASPCGERHSISISSRSSSSYSITARSPTLSSALSASGKPVIVILKSVPLGTPRRFSRAVQLSVKFDPLTAAKLISWFSATGAFATISNIAPFAVVVTQKTATIIVRISLNFLFIIFPFSAI